MSDYTPTTEEVRKAWAVIGEAEDFDRWLEEVKDEARAEGEYIGYDNGYEAGRIWQSGGSDDW